MRFEDFIRGLAVGTETYLKLSFAAHDLQIRRDQLQISRDQLALQGNTLDVRKGELKVGERQAKVAERRVGVEESLSPYERYRNEALGDYYETLTAGGRQDIRIKKVQMEHSIKVKGLQEDMVPLMKQYEELLARGGDAAEIEQSINMIKTEIEIMTGDFGFITKDSELDALNVTDAINLFNAVAILGTPEDLAAIAPLWAASSNDVVQNLSMLLDNPNISEKLRASLGGVRDNLVNISTDIRETVDQRLKDEGIEAPRLQTSVPILDDDDNKIGIDTIVMEPEAYAQAKSIYNTQRDEATLNILRTMGIHEGSPDFDIHALIHMSETWAFDYLTRKAERTVYKTPEEATTAGRRLPSRRGAAITQGEIQRQPLMTYPRKEIPDHESTRLLYER